MLNANAAVFVPKPIPAPAPAGATATDAAKLTDISPAGEGDAPAVEPALSLPDSTTTTDDFDADFEEVLNALEELQESQINQEVEEQLAQEMEFYESEYDEFFDDEEEHMQQMEQQHMQQQYMQQPAVPSSTRAPPPPFPRQRSGGAPKCKFAPNCRDGARRCRFSHQHMGACKYGSECRNSACNFNH